MIKYIKYLLVFLLATGFVACSEDEGAQILGGSVLSAANIDVKIHHLMMLLSTIPDFEILAL